MILHPNLDLSHQEGWKKPLAALRFLPTAVGAIHNRQLHPTNTFHLVDRRDVPIGLAAGDISYVATASDMERVGRVIVEFEDRRFFSHSGIDLIGIARALVRNVRAGRIVQGGSTITQQLVRNTLLTPDRSMTRKVLEVILSVLIERRYSKTEILYLYGNLVFLGPGVRGFQAASRLLYRRSIADLDPASICGLVGLLRQPSRDYPTQSPARFLKRQAFVTKIHGEHRGMRGDQAGSFAAVRIPNPIPARKLLKPRFSNLALGIVRQEGLSATDIKQVGLTINRMLQGRLDGLLREISRAPDIERIAAVVVGNRRGEVLAESVWENGRDCEFSPSFSGGIQPGSTFKPFAVLAAVEDGYRSDLTLGSAPFESACTTNADGLPWRVRNYAGNYRGKVTLAEATRFSDNTAFARLTEILPFESLESTYCRFGLCKPGQASPAIVLGAIKGGVSLLQLASAYSAIARNGVYLAPHLVRFIHHSDGATWWQPTKVESAVAASHAAIQSVKAVLASTLPTLAAFGFSGKTGTTRRGSLVAAYDDEVSVAIWLGHRSDRDESAVKGWSALRALERLIAEAFLGHRRDEFSI